MGVSGRMKTLSVLLVFLLLDQSAAPVSWVVVVIDAGAARVPKGACCQ